jgi:peptidoglycan hydrolase CwlO-like protein
VAQAISAQGSSDQTAFDIVVSAAMKVSQIAFLVVLAATPAAVSADGVDPLGKVYELMDSLAAKITKEGEEEAKAFHDYVEWCDDAAANLRNEIKTGEAKKEELDATIAKCQADIAACDAKIEELSKSIAEDEEELKKATEVRD